MPIDDPLMSVRPIPLRLVPFITGWPLGVLVDILTDDTIPDFPFITLFEWVDHQQQRRVSVENMRRILSGLKNKPDQHAKLALLPSSFFVWSDDLKNGVFLSCVNLHSIGDCPYVLDWDPSVHPYEDLIDECPDFSPAPSKQQLRKQNTAARNTLLRKMAEAKRTQHPRKSETWISQQIAKTTEAGELSSERVRKIIRE